MFIIENFGLWWIKYKILIYKLLYIMQYFYTVHYHCNVLGIVPIAYKTI